MPNVLKSVDHKQPAVSRSASTYLLKKADFLPFYVAYFCTQRRQKHKKLLEMCSNLLEKDPSSLASQF